MKTLIVGGGLSGLALASHLQKLDQDYVLVEARERFGGRILTEHHQGGRFDMGPAWFWSGQPRIMSLVDKLGLTKFEQYAEGALTFENELGQIEHGHNSSSMQGSWRLEGGLETLIDAIASRLPKERIRLNAPVTNLSKSGTGISTTLGDGEILKADNVVLALPPRVAANISFTPNLPTDAAQAMQRIPTWMAGHAKAVALFDKPFWRDAGLCGDAMSRMGPMVEIHDASPLSGGPYALFGFIGVSPQHRMDEPLLRRQITNQLGRLFGAKAAEPIQLFLKDWAFDTYTSTEADKVPIYTHPTYGRPSAVSDLWDKSLHFSGTEVAPQFGGYIEGALEAAENVLEMLNVTERTK